MFALVGVAYAQTPVPDKPTVKGVQDQASIFYYADGKREIGRIGMRREIVDISKIPPYAQDAVLAAENRSFRTDPGFSPKAITRAAWNNMTGGAKQGGSTITQQLAKNYYSDINNRTMKRKFQELFISVKLEDEMDKSQILELYLNTIYYGRNTYGIQAAAREYFGVTDISKIKKDQAALLAGIIQNPNRDPGDPKNLAWATERYQYVLNGLVTMGKMTETEAAQYKQQLPKLRKRSADNVYAGQKGYMLRRAVLELERQGITEQDISTMGLRVHTTFNAEMMVAAKNAVEKTIPALNPQKITKKIEFGLVAVEPGTGKVRAIYGGRDYLKDQFDNVWASQVQSGSTFKPYVLATALKEGHSLRSLTDGGTPRYFLGPEAKTSPPGFKVRNGGNYGVVDLVKATQMSINTSYVQTALQVGLPDVIKTAGSLGVAEDQLEPDKDKAGLALGQSSIRPVEQAAGYAGFAAGGRYYQPRVLEKVLKSDNKTRYKTLKYTNRAALSPDIAADVTYALQSVVKPGGTGAAAALADGRPVAGKTGTTNDNVASWFSGYVPQLSATVSMWNVDRKTMFVPGYGAVTGGAVPARIWKAFMDPATRGMEVKQFPPPANVGQQTKWVTPKPTPTPSASQTPNCRPNRPDWAQPPECRDEPRPGDDNQNKPCERPNQQDCNPNLPPTDPDALEQWCRFRPFHQACRDEESPGPGEPPRPNNRTNTVQTYDYGRLDDD
ncbi:hypothetical protein DPM19_13420 [Actinomadura craniellae]|uniref:Uncharacterized protein n=1 Tax=Actinomadura craniellae TaxID=2231787 RepID=A0A365H6S4_9ACTN|nr:hypothetical protein DPM19_13420 [Actinomadura craniellae]